MKQAGMKIRRLLLALILILALQPTAAFAQENARGNSFTNQMLGSRTCEYGGKIYYGYGDTLYSVKKDGTGKKAVFQMKNAIGLNGFTQIAVYDKYIYALFDSYFGAEDKNQQLIRMKLDGSGLQNYGRAASFSIADGRIYYTKEVLRESDGGSSSQLETAGIYVMDLDGKNSKALVKKDVRLLAVDETYIYYHYGRWNHETFETELYRCNKNGKNHTRLLAKTSRAAVSGGYVYYLRTKNKDGGDSVTTVYRKNINDRSIKKVYACRGSVNNFYVEDENLYLSSVRKGLIRVNVPTGKAKLVNRHEGAGIRGVHGNLIIFDQYLDDAKNDTNADIVLASLSTGKKIKKIGKYLIL